VPQYPRVLPVQRGVANGGEQHEERMDQFTPEINGESRGKQQSVERAAGAADQEARICGNRQRHQAALVPDCQTIGRANPDAAYSTLEIVPQLHHYGADALPAAGWPAGGVALATWGLNATSDGGPNASFRAFSDLHGGVFAGGIDVAVLVRFGPCRSNHDVTISRGLTGPRAVAPITDPPTRRPVARSATSSTVVFVPL